MKIGKLTVNYERVCCVGICYHLLWRLSKDPFHPSVPIKYLPQLKTPSLFPIVTNDNNTGKQKKWSKTRETNSKRELLFVSAFQKQKQPNTNYEYFSRTDCSCNRATYDVISKLQTGSLKITLHTYASRRLSRLFEVCIYLYLISAVIARW